MSPYRLLSSHGIKGPRPLPLAGNFLSIRKVMMTALFIQPVFELQCRKVFLFDVQVGHNEFLEEQIKTFGLIFG